MSYSPSGMFAVECLRGFQDSKMTWRHSLCINQSNIHKLILHWGRSGTLFRHCFIRDIPSSKRWHDSRNNAQTRTVQIATKCLCLLSVCVSLCFHVVHKLYTGNNASSNMVEHISDVEIQAHVVILTVSGKVSKIGPPCVSKCGS